MKEPSIESSTRQERLEFILETFKCISNCEICGNCSILHGRDAEEVFQDYILGKRTFREICIEIRDRR